MNRSIALVILLLFPLVSMSQDADHTPARINEDCFRLGAAAAFSEMVRFDVKKLALGTPLSPREMSVLEDELRRTIARQGVEAYLEKDLIVTDLFPEDVAEGKYVMLVYKGATLDEYLALKEKKNALVRDGNYSGQARRDIAREFGRMLSYSEAAIDEKLK